MSLNVTSLHKTVADAYGLLYKELINKMTKIITGVVHLALALNDSSLSGFGVTYFGF